MQVLRLLLWPLGLIYGVIIALRNTCFDWGILPIQKVTVPVISVGNLSFGGTGKTPHVDYLVNLLKTHRKPAVLLRGYGRTSKGFLQVTSHASSETVGDEALFYKMRHGKEVTVAVCEKRVEGAKQLLDQSKDINVIVLDDAYQHRYLHRDLDILLIDYNHPYWRDGVAPSGRLREFSSGRKRADVIVVTKCPDDLSSSEKERWKNRLGLGSEQHLFFSKIVYGKKISFEDKPFPLPDKILLITGIAKPEGLVQHLSKIAEVTHLSFKDHHDFTSNDIQEIHELFDTFAEQDKVIITTAKDFVRLNRPAFKSMMAEYPWFYQDISINIDDEEKFNKIINSVC